MAMALSSRTPRCALGSASEENSGTWPSTVGGIASAIRFEPA